MNSNNPLSKHFRHPAIYFSLPSKGKYWPEGALNLPLSGEIPVFPMTTKDEIILRTPDALMNGEGVISVIQSCCPNIIDGWKIPSIDLDAILIAIRIASYGEEMDVESKCPNCGETTPYGIPLNSVLDSLQTPNYSKTLDYQGMTIRFRPTPYELTTELNIMQFQEDQILNTLRNAELSDEDKKRMFDEQMDRLVDLNVMVLAANTESISTEEGEVVSNKEFIKEFYENTDTKLVKKVRSHIDALREESKISAHHVQCSDCGHEYDMNIEFDQASFFGTGS
jgi:predicted RNA-binding Zn-ribbon protein involved in translation (DUF1610 family)